MNPSLSEEKFNEFIRKIADAINVQGITALDTFKGCFQDYRRVSDIEVINNSAPIQDRINEALLAGVLRAVTVAPKKCKPRELPDCLYRGCNISPPMLRKEGGYHRAEGERSLFKHQESTVRSVYISTTTELTIACEFAMQSIRKQGGGGNWVYKIDPVGAASCNEHFSPITLHDSENEYVFTHHLPVSKIIGVAWAEDIETLATDFYPFDQDLQLLKELVCLGKVKF